MSCKSAGLSAVLPKVQEAGSAEFKLKKGCSVLYSQQFIISLFIIYALINFTGCCVYSFSGASVPKHIKSIAIPPTLDRSGSGEPGLGESFSNKLTQKFVDDNTLQIANKSNSDATLSCIISSLNDAPSVVSAGENVTKRRITITVQVTYKDMVKRKTVYEKSFSGYGDYASSGSISERKVAIDSAIDNITNDILLDTVSGW
ncbi:MAG: LptE family protein [Ignavibacteriaceae bacterium]|nr:LptE family protein [Ignavibacteriaceae bacterium]